MVGGRKAEFVRRCNRGWIRKIADVELDVSDGLNRERGRRGYDVALALNINPNR